jgi:enoyl-CoA hydratase/carnithine racemase
MSTYETIIYEKKDRVAVITLNRPEKMNAMSLQMCLEFAEAAADIENDKNITVLVLTGTGKGFCPGADLSELKDPEIRLRREKTSTIVDQMRRFTKPVVCAVNGTATAGGFEIIVNSDIVIASETARIGDAHANFVGLGPVASTMAPYKMHRKKATELLFTGDLWPAAELEKAGLVNHVVPAEQLMEKAMEIANKIASHMPLAMIALKKVINMAGLSDPETLYAYVREVTARIGKTEDFAEGMKAFAEKRKPQYKGQ